MKRKVNILVEKVPLTKLEKPSVDGVSTQSLESENQVEPTTVSINELQPLEVSCPEIQEGDEDDVFSFENDIEESPAQQIQDWKKSSKRNQKQTSEKLYLRDTPSASSEQSKHDLPLASPVTPGTITKQEEYIMSTFNSPLITVNEPPPTTGAYGVQRRNAKRRKAAPSTSSGSEETPSINSCLSRLIVRSLTQPINICVEPLVFKVEENPEPVIISRRKKSFSRPERNIPRTASSISVEVPEFVEKRDVTYQIVRKMSEELNVIVDPNSPPPPQMVLKVEDGVGEIKGRTNEGRRSVPNKNDNNNRASADGLNRKDLERLRGKDDEVCLNIYLSTK